MTEQERNVLLNELRQQESQREKQIKRERFRRLNPYAKKGAVVFAGSSLMEQFPLYEFLQDDDAAPIGSNIAVYAQHLGLDSSYAVQMVCLSTLLSLITLPVMLSLAAALGFA